MAKKEEKLPCEVCPLCVSIAAAKQLKDGLKEMLPPDFREHARTARKEQLLAARSLIDAAIDRLEQQPKRSVKASKGVRHLKSLSSRYHSSSSNL